MVYLNKRTLAKNFELIRGQIAHRASFVFIQRCRSVAACRADIEIAWGADPLGVPSGLDQSDCLGIELCVGLLCLQRPGEGAGRRGIPICLRLFHEFRIHGFDLDLFACKGGFQIFERRFHVDRMNLTAGFTTQLTDDAGVVGGVNLFGLSRRAKEAGAPLPSVGIGFYGEGNLFGVGV